MDRVGVRGRKFNNSWKRKSMLPVPTLLVFKSKFIEIDKSFGKITWWKNTTMVFHGRLGKYWPFPGLHYWVPPCPSTLPEHITSHQQPIRTSTRVTNWRYILSSSEITNSLDSHPPTTYKTVCNLYLVHSSLVHFKLKQILRQRFVMLLLEWLSNSNDRLRIFWKVIEKLGKSFCVEEVFQENIGKQL